MNTTNTTKSAAGISGISTVLVSVLALVAAIGFLAAAAYIGTLSKTGATQTQNAQAENSQTVPQVSFKAGSNSLAADDSIQDSWVTKYHLAQNANSQNVQDSWVTRFHLTQNADPQNISDSWVTKFRLAQADGSGSTNSACAVLNDPNQRARCIGVR